MPACKYHPEKSQVTGFRDPCVAAAIAAGVRNVGYDTVRYGWINAYRGEADVELGGMRYHAVGHMPVGDSVDPAGERPARDGYIQFTPVPTGG